MPRYNVTPGLSGQAGQALLFGGQDNPSDDRILVGRVNEAGPLRAAEMDASGEAVVAIFGKRGSGKSFTLGVLAEGLCTVERATDIGKCSHRKSALLMDTLNVFWSTENPFTTSADLERFPDEAARLESWRIEPPQLNATVWVPAGFRNPHTPSHYRDFAIAVAELSAEDLADLFDLDAQRDLIGQLLGEVLEKCGQTHNMYSSEDMLRILEDDEEIKEYYSEGTIRAARQRLRSLARLPLFSSRDGTPLRELLVPGRLSVLELGEVPNTLRAVVASVLMRRIHAERARASDAEKQLALNTRLSQGERDALTSYLATALPPAWVLIDEAQNILPSSREVKSSDAVVRFVREGRNFGLSLAFTTQQPSAVDQRILSQADTIICHKLTVAGDLARMRDNLKCGEPVDVRVGGQSYDLAGWLRTLDRGQAIVTNTDTERVFALEVRPRVCPHGGTGFRADVGDSD